MKTTSPIEEHRKASFCVESLLWEGELQNLRKGLYGQNKDIPAN